MFNGGNLKRDFTYIEDIVDGFVRAVNTPLKYEIINLGNGSPVELQTFVRLLENELGVKAQKNMLPMQPGDVYETFADTTKAERLLNFRAQTSFAVGIKSFVRWFQERLS